MANQKVEALRRLRPNIVCLNEVDESVRPEALPVMASELGMSLAQMEALADALEPNDALPLVACGDTNCFTWSAYSTNHASHCFVFLPHQKTCR